MTLSDRLAAVREGTAALPSSDVRSPCYRPYGPAVHDWRTLPCYATVCPDSAHAGHAAAECACGARREPSGAVWRSPWVGRAITRTLPTKEYR